MKTDDPKNQSGKSLGGKVLRAGAIAGGALAGAWGGAAIASRTLKKGRPIVAGEDMLGKVIYAKGTATGLTPANAVGLKPAIKRMSRKGGIIGAIGKTARKADDAMGIQMRHYGVGIGKSQVSQAADEGVLKEHSKAFGKFKGSAHGIFVDSEPSFKNQNQRKKAGKQIRAREEVVSDSYEGAGKGVNLVTNNCEHYARGIAGQPRVSTQIRRIMKGAAIGGAVIGGSAYGATKQKTQFEIAEEAIMLAAMPTNASIRAATTGMERAPSMAQAKAGNYAKGHISFQGLPISIENPRGSLRKGDGWVKKMPHHYGYIKNTLGRDGDHMDVIIGPHPASDQAFVVDALDRDGKFDEHKCLLGFRNKVEAQGGYAANYPKGWKIGKITPMHMDTFKVWVKHANVQAPAATQMLARRVVAIFLGSK